MFLSLVSGSSGNCSLISDGKTTLLVDCGLSAKKLEEALLKAKVNPNDITAMLITHEHSDHIKGAGVVSRKYNLPVYATLKTHEYMDLGKIDNRNIKYINPDVDFEIGTIGVRPFSIPHDAADPVGYNFFTGNKKLSLATDIGIMNDNVLEHISGSLAVLLESNHDVDMLRSGPYPLSLKHRILSCDGHLSNADCAKTLAHLASCGLRCAVLAHISEHNNTPLMARACAVSELNKYGFDEVEVIPASDMLEIEIQENCNENSNSR
jgi:phosphoribosyl 1,2-cyclic phosphodiesterase